MRVLVTGGCGFIGSNLAVALKADGHVVRVLDNLSTGRADSLDLDEVDLVRGDVRDEAATRIATSGIDAVVHLAAQPGVLMSRERPIEDFETNLRGLLNVLAGARQAGVQRVVFASSMAAAGTLAAAGHRLVATSPYAAAKRGGEAYCASFFASYGLPCVSLRFANVYGPRSDQKQSVVARFIRGILADRRITVDGDGTQVRDLIHVRDVCAVIRSALMSPRLEGQVLPVATGVLTSVAKVADIVQVALGVAGVERLAGTSRSSEPSPCPVDVEATRQTLGWQAAVPLEAGIADTCQWFREARVVQASRT